jgi:hypothetical protein
MSEDNVIDLLKKAEQINVDVWLDGGWGEDALLGGITVRCLTAEAQLLYHQGYEHTEKDIHDVQLLCRAFGLSIPKEYEKQ